MKQARVAIGLLLAALLLFAEGPGFRSRKQFEEHFAKHGHEFGNITADQYLHLAQELRDAPAGGPILGPGWRRRGAGRRWCWACAATAGPPSDAAGECGGKDQVSRRGPEQTATATRRRHRRALDGVARSVPVVARRAEFAGACW